MAKSFDPDLVILDVMMPDMTGPETLQAPRDRPDTALHRRTSPRRIGALSGPNHATGDTVVYRDERRCSRDEIPEDSILTRDIHTASGLVFMKSGALITPRVVSLLSDLEQLRNPVDSVWITEDN